MNFGLRKPISLLIMLFLILQPFLVKPQFGRESVQERDRLSQEYSNALHVMSRDTGIGLHPRDQPSSPLVRAVTGNEEILVIMIEFQDKPHNSNHTASYYEDLLFNTTNAGSMYSYYKEGSFEQLSINGTITSKWYVSNKLMTYYGADSGEFPDIDDLNGDIYEYNKKEPI